MYFYSIGHKTGQCRSSRNAVKGRTQGRAARTRVHLATVGTRSGGVPSSKYTQYQRHSISLALFLAHVSLSTDTALSIISAFIKFIHASRHVSTLSSIYNLNLTFIQHIILFKSQ